MSTWSLSYRKYQICRLNPVYFKEGSRKSRQKNINPLLTTTRPTTNLLPELPLIIKTRSPCRIISIEGKMEERNKILEQVNMRKISVEDKINTEERNNILEKLERPVILNGWDLEFASEDLKRDREIVMAAVKQDFRALEFASDTLKRDRDILMAAVKQGGNALKFASEDLQKDRKIVMAAVNQNGWALRFASDILQKDREIVMAAVNQNGWALRFASEEVQKDREIVMAAVKKNG